MLSGNLWNAVEKIAELKEDIPLIYLICPT